MKIKRIFDLNVSDADFFNLLALGEKAGKLTTAARVAGYVRADVLGWSENEIILELTNVQTWLRESMGIHIFIERGDPENTEGWFAVVHTLEIEADENSARYAKMDHSPGIIQNYTEALCDGIERALKMLEPDENMDHAESNL